MNIWDIISQINFIVKQILKSYNKQTKQTLNQNQNAHSRKFKNLIYKND